MNIVFHEEHSNRASACLNKQLLFQVEHSIWDTVEVYINGLVQDCSNSIANALELLQSCTKPSMSSLVASRKRHSVSNYW